MSLRVVYQLFSLRSVQIRGPIPPRCVAKISKILFISRQKLKTSLCERQDFFYCLLIYLIYLKSGPRTCTHPYA